MILDDFFTVPDRVTEHLMEARELVARPGGWTQGHMARTASGDSARYGDSNAVSFCAYGAIRAVGGADDEVDALTKVIGYDKVMDWNDEKRRRQDEVVRAFDKAIRRRMMMPWFKLAGSIAIRFMIVTLLLIGLFFLAGCERGTGTSRGHCTRAPSGTIMCDAGHVIR